MGLVQRAAVVVTEDMPVDPEARDLQVGTCNSSAMSGPAFSVFCPHEGIW